MDRDRLKEVHQTDLTEGKINEDFVDWLKTKGPTYLLVVLIGLAAWLFIVRFKQQKHDHLNAGWSAFLSAQLPGSLEDVAAEYADLRGLALLANLRAADVYLQAVIAQAPLGADLSDATVESLSDEDRDKYLTRADRIYQAMIDADDTSPETALFTIGAMNGRAAVAESRGDAEQARHWYEQAAERAGAEFPRLAKRSQDLAESVEAFSRPISLPAEDDLPSQAASLVLEPATLDSALRDLLQTDEPADAFVFPPSAP